VSSSTAPISRPRASKRSAASATCPTPSLKQAPAPEPEIVARLGVTPLLRERMDALSLGQLRRVGLLGALVGEPGLLVLDEPTNGLDPEGVDMLLGLLEGRTRAGLATLLTTHERSFRDAAADEVIHLAHGRLEVADSAVSSSPCNSLPS
jgi:ABC-2 type transport system ATP-binding protein